MLKVGLTGGIGSGKTTIAKIFISLGVPVFFADIEAKKLMETDSDVVKGIKNLFGDEAFNGSSLNRNYLAGIVFADQNKLKKLNQIVHPAVHRHFAMWVEENKDNNYIIEEAALLFESGSFKYFDYIVLVTAPESLKLKRVMARDGASKEAVEVRMKSQMPEDEKIPLSHYLIFNDDENMVTNQVIAFHEKMISLNKK
jgi:dephospho-CoA kinase